MAPPVSAVARRAAALAVLSAGVVAVIVLATPHFEERTSLVEDASAFFTAEKEYAASHPVYTRCAAKVAMPEFVKEVRKTCGDVHELTTVKGPCKAMLTKKSHEFGCCWESVMKAYDVLDPQAAHKWRLWQGTISGKGGVTFDSSDCGESMGEKSYSDLKGEVDSLKDVVNEQQSEISDIMGALWGYGSSYYYGGSPSYNSNYDPYTGSNYYNYYDPMTGAYFKNGKQGAAALKEGVAPGPPRRGAPVPPLGAEQQGLKEQGEQQPAAPRSAQMKSWWNYYWSTAAHEAAAREHYRAAAIHNAATNAAINSAYVHAENAEAYGTQYNELMDKYHELEQHRYATDASTRTAKVAAQFASAARRDAERHRDVAKHAAHVAVSAVSAMSSGAPLLPMSDTVAPVGGTAAFFTQNDPADKAVQKLSSEGVNVGF